MEENTARRSKRKRSHPLHFHDKFHDDGNEKHLRKKKKVDTHYYECEIVEVDAANSCVQIHSVGYPDEDDQWQPFTEDDFPVVKKMARFDYRSETVHERANALKATLFLEVKKHLLATRKADPEIRIELPTQSDAYENVFGKVGTVTRSNHGKLMKEVRISEIESILGAKWNVRVKNVNGDFHFVTEGTVKLWITDRTPIKKILSVLGESFSSICMSRIPYWS